MAEYGIPSADPIKSPEYSLACRCIIPSANYYNLCRFKLSKIEINQKGFYSAGSFCDHCLYADLFHFAFQECTACRNTSVDLHRNVSPRCPLTWRFDLFRSLCCSIKNPYLGTNLKWSIVDWMRHPDPPIILDALLYLFHWLNLAQSNESNKSNQLNKKRSLARYYKAIFIPQASILARKIWRQGNRIY